MPGLFLTPGAGSDRTSPSLVAIEKAVKPLAVVRHDFPYRRNGKKAPDRAPVLVADVVEAATTFENKVGGPLVLGGRSMGGRICSMAVAEGLPAAGLVLISYPLHAPGRPDKPRIEHLPSIKVPCLFVSGTRDAFGSPDELEAATKTIKGKVTHVWLAGGDHGLKTFDEQVATAVAGWVGSVLRARGGRSRGTASQRAR